MAAKLKIAGTWSGVLEVELENWTIPMIRAEVAKRSNCGPESINLICAGKVLKDGDGNQKLIELGIKNNAKILASRAAVDEGKSLREELMAEDERSSRLSRVKAAAIAMAERHADGSLPIEDFNIELEDQSGQKVNLGSETDQRAVMMGLMLHTNGKQLIRRQKYEDALEVLTMGEEAFSLCNPKVIELVDNVPILQIDIVWCYFMQRDIKWLSEAGIRLTKAREGIERAYGKDASRVRLLQAGRFPEVALYLRLELLEGVIAYYSGQFEKCRSSLTSAQAKYFKLQVPDEALSLLLSMGYTERKAKRALRMSNQDIEMAIDFLVEEKAKKEQRIEEDIHRRNEIMEQKRYGMTPLRKAVDLERMKELVSIGFEKALAAEALRRNENDNQKALDDLTNPETNAVIQLELETKKRKRQRRAADAAIEELISMGFERSRVVAAVQTFGTRDQALSQLLAEQDSNPTVAANNAEPSVSTPNNVEAISSSNIDSSAIPPNINEIEKRDEEMESELAQELENTDAFSDYDIEITKEGEAINEYLALLDSATNTDKVSSSH